MESYLFKVVFGLGVFFKDNDTPNDDSEQWRATVRIWKRIRHGNIEQIKVTKIQS